MKAFISDIFASIDFTIKISLVKYHFDYIISEKIEKYFKGVSSVSGF